MMLYTTVKKLVKYHSESEKSSREITQYSLGQRRQSIVKPYYDNDVEQLAWDIQVFQKRHNSSIRREPPEGQAIRPGQ